MRLGCCAKSQDEVEGRKLEVMETAAQLFWSLLWLASLAGLNINIYHNNCFVSQKRASHGKLGIRLYENYNVGINMSSSSYLTLT